MREVINELLASCGIEIDGPNPYDIHIHNPLLYQRVWAGQNLGLGEAYMDGWWDCDQLDEFFARLLRFDIQAHLKITPKLALNALVHRLFNFQTKRRSKQVAYRHYDLGNELFQAMLDSRLNYSCGYWKGARTLEEAQQNKLELICQKLMLKPGMRMLDIGCGWGALAQHAARHYGVEVVGVTLSAPQKAFAETACRGLPVTFRLQDYRDLPGEVFDRVASVGMFEHVGHKNYATFMEVVGRCLSEEGLCLLHTIGGSPASEATADPWITKYIFPNGQTPSLRQVSQAMHGRFVMEDWHNFGPDYDRTLMAWYENFSRHWPELEASFDQRFFRMWKYYLLSCAGAFRARDIQLWQIVKSKHGVQGGLKVRDLAGEKGRLPTWSDKPLPYSGQTVSCP
jgi:cyclopropane-fatty-acyl-phospholipid synthase